MENLFNYLLQNPSMLAWSTLRIDADGVYYIDGALWNYFDIPCMECDVYDAVCRKIHDITGLSKIIFADGNSGWYLYWNDKNKTYD